MTQISIRNPVAEPRPKNDVRRLAREYFPRFLDVIGAVRE